MSLIIEYNPPLDFGETINSNVVIYSIGYEGYTIESFICRLLELGIEQIIDVRKNPLSRKPGFSKNQLRMALEQNQIEYVHIPALGIPSDLRKNLKTAKDYKELFDFYEAEILPYQEDAIQRAIELIKERRSALMCFEAEPLECHRTRLSIVIERRTNFSHCYIRRK